MAFLLPENIPSRGDLSSRFNQVGRALRDNLPDEVTVWLVEKNSETGAEPYLIILDPLAGGIIALEVRNRPRTRKRNRWQRSFQPAEPIEVRREVKTRATELRKGIDLQKIDDLPVEAAVAWPDLDLDDLNAHGLDGNDPAVLTRSDLGPGRFHPALRRVLKRRGRPMNQAVENKARAVVNPEIILAPSSHQIPLFTDPDIPPENVIKVMDRKQERVAQYLGAGYRLIRGVAGSGKTLILIYRARRLARFFPNQRILLLCFNRVLSKALEQQVQQYPNIKAINIDRLAYNVNRSANSSVPKNVNNMKTFDYNQQVIEAKYSAARLPDNRRYDAVFVDEGQDLSHEALDLAYSMLKPDCEDFVMVIDSAQNLYRRRINWNPPNQTARGRTKIFQVNYRNTREILEFAWKFLSPESLKNSSSSRSQKTPRRSDITSSSDYDDPEALIPPEAALRSGSSPRVMLLANHRQEAEFIADEVIRMHDNGLKYDDMAVIYGNRALNDQLSYIFRRRGLPYFDVRSNRNSAASVQGHVRVSNLYHLKGLEFSRVFIGGVDTITVSKVDEEDQPEAVRKLLYVAMTRAMDELTITYSGSGWIGKALSDAQL